jgi:hypothetical protein
MDEIALAIEPDMDFEILEVDTRSCKESIFQRWWFIYKGGLSRDGF